MKPAIRSSSGVAMEGRTGVSKEGSRASVAVSGRAPQQQVAMKKVQPPSDLGSRSAPGPPRDQSGRFIRGGSKLEEVDPVPVKPMEAVGVQVAAVGVLDEEDANSAGDSGSFKEGNEVCGRESEGCDLASSSENSDFEVEKDEGLGVKSGKSVEQQGMCSSQSGKVGDSGAHQVFAEMPHSVQVAAGGNMGIVSSAGGSEKRVGGVPKAPWVNLFKDNRSLGMGIKLEEWEDEGDLVMLEEDDVDVVEEAWGYCLVGLFAGKFPGWTAVRKLREGWKVDCTYWRHRSGWLVFKFQSEEDRCKVLEGGPYFAYGGNLILKCLPRCFRFEGEDVSSVPIWIKLPGLPLDCWNARALGKIASRVGKPISTDKLTLSKERISFARVLVEVDAAKDIISEVEVRLPTGEVYRQLVIPELIPKFCKSCKAFGHMEGRCGKVSEGTKSKELVDKKKRTEGGGPLERETVIDKGTAADLVDPMPDKGPNSGGGLPGPNVIQAGSGSVPEVMGDMGVAGLAAPCALPADQFAVPPCPSVAHAAIVEGAAPLEAVPMESGVGGWTRVGKKGKRMEKAGQPSVAAVQQLPADDGGGSAALQQPVGEAVVPYLSVQQCGMASVQPRYKSGEPIPEHLLRPYVPRWPRKGKGRQSYKGME